jgi:hypothetical protein
MRFGLALVMVLFGAFVCGCGGEEPAPDVDLELGNTAKSDSAAQQVTFSCNNNECRPGAATFRVNCELAEGCDIVFGATFADFTGDVSNLKAVVSVDGAVMDYSDFNKGTSSSYGIPGAAPGVHTIVVKPFNWPALMYGGRGTAQFTFGASWGPAGQLTCSGPFIPPCQN